MKGRLIICGAGFFFFQFHFCAAQNSEIRFNPVLNNNGETLQKINGITQDPHGYMWFAGQDARCLYRYDGHRMISFRNDPLDSNSLGGTDLETVYADDSGMIWIGFNDAGLDQYNPATGIFKHYRAVPNNPDSLGSNGVNAILKDKKGKIWVGTRGGLDCLDEKTGKFIHYRNKAGDPRSLSYNIVRVIYEDRRGAIWVGTGFPFGKGDDGGLNRIEKDGSITRFLHDPKNPHSLINNKVRSIFEDSHGVFWIGTAGDGLHTMDREKGTFERLLYNPAKPDQLSRPPLKKEQWTDHITFIGEDSTGAIWIGTYASGISRYDTLTKKITRYEYSNGFPSGSCWIAYISRDGVLWFSTQQNQLFRVDPFRKKIEDITTGFTVFSFQEDKKGSLWIGTGEGGLCQFDKSKKLIHRFNPDTLGLNLSTAEIRSLFQYQNDSIMLGTRNGIFVMNTMNGLFSRFNLETKNKDESEDGTNSIIQDMQGFIWFATGGGLIKYDPANGSLKEYHSDSKNPGAIGSNRVFRVLEDKSGGIWAGALAGGGVNRLDRQTDRFRNYLTGFNITSMCQDSEGKIWAGTEKGLYWYSKSSDSMLAYFDSRVGVDTLRINGIIEDDLRNLWISTPSAIIKLNSARNKTYLFGEEYGIIPHTISPGIHKTGKGEILIGHYSGFYVFSPNDLPFEKPYKIIVTDFLINNHSAVNIKKSPLIKPIEDIDTVSLKYNQNTITFYFAATDYRAPETIKYFTMLENYDNSWREAGIEKSANYFNIPPGKYVFKVKTINIDLIKAEKEIQIIIYPPWWQSWWAYFVYGLLLLFGIWSIVRFQKQRIIKSERQKVQLKELAQAKEIEKAYTELKSTQAQLIQSEKMASLGSLTAGIAHEIQNPLNFVNNFSEINAELLEEWKREINSGNMEAANSLAKDIAENSEKIIEHGQRADLIVKSMLQHSRISTGQKELADINALSDEYLRLSYHGLRAKDKAFNSNFTTQFDPAIEKINIIPQDIGRVLLNLYNNAFYAVMEKKKMNPAFEPLVTVSTKKNENKVIITVTDNGIGIPEKLKDKIFQPFFTTKPTGQGTGLGLSLSYDIIKAHGGEIKVSSDKNEGVEFTIELPSV